jgi:hypothetical protein
MGGMPPWLSCGLTPFHSASSGEKLLSEMPAPMPRKPRIRLRAEVMPSHCLVPPEGAPGCYGDLEERIRSSACVLCRLSDRCADFVGRARLDRAAGVGEGRALRTRAVWRRDAPLILDRERLHARLDLFARRRLTAEEERLWSITSGEEEMPSELVITAWRAHAGGLITLDAAIEFAEAADAFLGWL